jgi:hypothetical protein
LCFFPRFLTKYLLSTILSRDSYIVLLVHKTLITSNQPSYAEVNAAVNVADDLFRKLKDLERHFQTVGYGNLSPRAICLIQKLHDKTIGVAAANGFYPPVAAPVQLHEASINTIAQASIRSPSVTATTSSWTL